MAEERNDKKTGFRDRISEQQTNHPGAPRADFPVVGIGASAGGLESMSSLFSALPEKSGAAFVIVQHLDPNHPSTLHDLLKRYTKMTVLEAQDGITVEPDHIYIIPPTKNIFYVDGKVQLTQQDRKPGESHTIDYFFESLAEQLHDRATCIILSGTGSDGVAGAKAIKAQSGMVIVQQPETARYDGMPKAVISAGLADFVLPPDKILPRLIGLVLESNKQGSGDQPESGLLQKVFGIIRARTKHDFTGYKLSTIRRRIERRMHVQQMETLASYVKLLEKDNEEVEALFRDLLINVTSFFRNAEAFDSLKPYIKELLNSRTEGSTVRIWATGCSTGEEAYSLAMVVEECLEELKKYHELQVFGTDIDPEAINSARAGIYSASIAEDVGEERLKKFFLNKDGQYQVKKELREKLVFAIQDFIEDPPFSRIDIISARNILIYLDSELQKKIIPVLHYALSENGILFLGTAETIGDFGDLFEILDRKWKIHRRKDARSEMGKFVLPTRALWQDTNVPEHPNLPLRPTAASERSLLQALPPSVLVDPKYRVVFVQGETGKYLELSQGEMSFNILDMARPALKADLSAALREASTEKREVVREIGGIPVAGGSTVVRITVRCVVAVPERSGYLIITFQDIKETPKRRKSAGAESEMRIKELEEELQFTRENLRSTIEELETANEELRSANEEYQSTNEELQSTNEELETSREELQSVNEELMTMNTEFQNKIDQLSVINDDMKNLLNSTNVATVFLDNEMRIKRFTPAATAIFNIIEGDIGRPLDHVTSLLQYDPLVETVRKVSETLVPVREKVRTKGDYWYSMRIHPYRTTNNIIAGLVLSFIDINDYVGERRIANV